MLVHSLWFILNSIRADISAVAPPAGSDSSIHHDGSIEVEILKSIENNLWLYFSYRFILMEYWIVFSLINKSYPKIRRNLNIGQVHVLYCHDVIISVGACANETLAPIEGNFKLKILKC